MDKIHPNVLDVIALLLEDQGEISNIVYEKFKKNSEQDSEGLILLEFTLELISYQDKLDWKRFFMGMEMILSSVVYRKYSEMAETHILEGLSNLVDANRIKASYLTDHAGPKARASMKAWELAMSGKTIF